MRIREKDLERLVYRINEETGSPKSSYTKGEDGQYRANIGNYYLDFAYGGVKLVQMINEHGAIRDVSTGYGTKRELFNFMTAFLAGMEAQS